MASICEDCSNDELAAASRKRILKQDPSNAFALAALASNLHFEPEKAIQFYRRLQQVRGFKCVTKLGTDRCQRQVLVVHERE